MEPGETGPFRAGCIRGALFAIAAVTADVVRTELAQEAGGSTSKTPQDLFLGLAIAILLVGSVYGIALALRRSTRRSGVGVLVGLTLTLPVALAVSVIVTYEAV